MHFVCFVTVKFFFFHQRIPLEVAIERKRQDIAQFLTDVSAIKDHTIGSYISTVDLIVNSFIKVDLCVHKKKSIPLAVILVLLIWW